MQVTHTPKSTVYAKGYAKRIRQRIRQRIPAIVSGDMPMVAWKKVIIHAIVVYTSLPVCWSRDAFWLGRPAPKVLGPKHISNPDVAPF